ncbi:MAG: type III secretion system chaperone [Acidimicrobiales bacterium]
MTSAPIADGDAPERFNEVVTSWARQWREGGMLGEVEHQHAPDDKGHWHWLIRLHGDEKDVITIWLSLRQRTVHVETELMPAPEENHEELYRFMLVKNAELRLVHLAIGPEAGIYLMSEVPVGDLGVERLDELVGATMTYVDEIFPTAMTMGYGSLYRRRPKRNR